MSWTIHILMIDITKKNAQLEMVYDCFTNLLYSLVLSTTLTYLVFKWPIEIGGFTFFEIGDVPLRKLGSLQLTLSTSISSSNTSRMDSRDASCSSSTTAFFCDKKAGKQNATVNWWEYKIFVDVDIYIHGIPLPQKNYLFTTLTCIYGMICNILGSNV